MDSKTVLMLFHPNSSRPKGHTLGLKLQTLFEPIFARQ